MTGSGNDFVFLDGRESGPADWPADRIRRVCARRTGVGADGLVILSPAAPDRISMLFFNSDGSRGEMCGNAALCATRLAARLGLAAPEHMVLETDGGAFGTRCEGKGHRARLNLPDFEAPVAVPAIQLNPAERGAWFTTVGVPHLVVPVPDVAAVDLVVRGAELRAHPAVGQAGANANFVSQGPDRSEWSMRTFERGVEGETLACGTGAVAVAATLVSTRRAKPPIALRTRSGLLLEVDLTALGGRMIDVWLGGEGRLVFQGELGGE